jgi:C-terminal processing protease CtpA/Prc
MNQMPLINSGESELRRCIMHLWPSFDGLGLNLKNSQPHIVRHVDVDSPAQYAGVLANDLILKIGDRVVEYEKFDTVLKLIKDMMKKEAKVDLLLINSKFYEQFKKNNNIETKKADQLQKIYSDPKILAQIKPYESPRQNPNIRSREMSVDVTPEPRLCHLLTWPTYNGYGFFVEYNSEGCFVKNVEPNSPAQLGGLRAYDRVVEINGRQVNAKDRDFIMKLINKHKNGSNSTSTMKGSTMKSQSAYSLSNKSAGGQSTSSLLNYLNILVVDPTTYKWLKSRKVDISTKNKSLKIQECFTPAERNFDALNTTITNNVQSSTDMDPYSTIKMENSNSNSAKSIQIKMCTLRRLKNRENLPLGFEMTKRGNNAHYISRVDPNTSASVSGLELNDYMIELNGKNIENDENSLLREKIFAALSPENGGEFQLTLINKEGYDYCIENNISLSHFIKVNKGSTKFFETPIEQSIVYNKNENSNLNHKGSFAGSNQSNSTPRVCVIRKTSQDRELGFSIARIKNLNEHIINDVVPNSIADRAGLKPNDCLLEVNGENIENKSHAETVHKIVELAKAPTVEINLLVVERQHVNQHISNLRNQAKQQMVTHSNSNITDSSKKTLERQPSSSNTISNGTMTNGANNQSINLNTGTLPSTKHAPSINVYPEIKVCEFLGYPRGTQLGLVVTSDDYSHDVVKVAENSPAHKAGLEKGDIVLAVNDVNVEGNPALIELLNEFDENRPLKVLVASRYAYEWSKLLKIRISEKDWPNLKKFSTKFLPANDMATQYKTVKTYDSPNNYAVNNNNYSTYYETANNRGRNMLTRSEVSSTCNKQQLSNSMSHQPLASQQGFNNTNRTYIRSPSAGDYIDIPANRYNTTMTKRVITSAGTMRSNENYHHFVSAQNLSRSAVDITADGQVLRMCTLILNPSSPNPTDAEFGFDLVTKVGAGIRNGDYFIDTIDEGSPAAFSGLRTGDRLIEVDDIDVRNKSFEDVVRLINEAKLKCKLKLLVYPSAIINYGNPNIIDTNGYNNQAFQQQEQQKQQPYQDYVNRQHYEFSKNLYQQNNMHNIKQAATLSRTGLNSEYDSIYLKNKQNPNAILSKSSSNLNTMSNTMNGTLQTNGLLRHTIDLLRPLPRLCKIYKNDPSSIYSNIGFGVQTKQTSAIVPNYMRVSIVNYKSPSYLAGLDGGDFIIEVNGRNTLSMSHEEALHFIKSSYDINNYVKLLVVSEFCYNWLKEHDLLMTLNSEDSSVFSYADYLKNNHRFVPRLCKIKLFPYSKSFGFTLNTMNMRPSVNQNNKSGNIASYAHLIIKVDKESPAYASSLLKGDRIIECDGINVEGENEKQVTDRIFQAFVCAKQISLFVVDPDTDNFFKSKCIKLHSMLPIVQHITNSTDI